MRAIPSIEQLRQRPAMRALEEQYGRAAVVDAIRAEANAVRLCAAGGAQAADLDVVGAIERAVPVRLQTTGALSLRRVINATGVILHTNLGRAPLAAAAARRVSELATGYTNLEYDLTEGARGRRDVHAERLLCRLTGAEAAVVVNNNAAATLIVLAALATGREVVISRGELVEIGGGFRVPDVMGQSGALLREVGTTNRTRSADYAAAIGDKTALILRVHPSNFRIEGFTERPRLDELVAIGRRFNVLVAEDLGSGWLGSQGGGVPADLSADLALGEEPIVGDSLAAGADVVMFSGDKLLGGPQAGIIAGREPVISTIRRHPLMRAMRVDKMTYAALEGTLQEYAAARAADTVPVVRMLSMSADAIRSRSEVLVSSVAGSAITAEIVSGFSTVGGGSAPGSALPTQLVALSHPSLCASELEARLRGGDPPVIARIENDRVMIDLRTVMPEEDELLQQIVRSAAL
jgi:L-seryl-tRNA(Ser) seleniumtransferase